MYFAVRDGVPDSERLQLESTFSKCPDIIQVMHNITYLGVRLSSNFLQMIQENKEPVYYRSTPKEKKSVFENDRYVPILKDILHNFIKTPSIDSIFHLIPESDTNFVNLPNQRGLISKSNPGVASNLSSAHSGSSIAMAKNKASWATRRGRGTEKNDDGSDSLRDSDEGDIKTYGSRVIVFVIGGISCAELRAANEVMQNTGREVIVGSSNLIVPSLFINEVENLNSPLDSSDLFGVKSESVFIEKKNNDVSYKSKYSLKEVLAPTTAIPKRTNISSKPVTSTTASPLSKSVRAPLGKMGLFEVPSRSKSREVQKGSTSEQASTEQKKKKPWKFL